MATNRTRGMVEAELSKRIVQFEKEHLGRGPVDVRSRLVDDMIFVRIRGIMTPAEQQLASTPEGRSLVKEMRRQLFETSRSLLQDMVKEITGCNLVSLHTDMSTKTSERIVVLVVDADLEERYAEGRRTR